LVEGGKMNYDFIRKCNYIANRYPEAEEKFLLKMLEKVVK